MVNESYTSTQMGPDQRPLARENNEIMRTIGLKSLCIREDRKESLVLAVDAGEYFNPLAAHYHPKDKYEEMKAHMSPALAAQVDMALEELISRDEEYLAEIYPLVEDLVDHAMRLQADGWHVNPGWDGSAWETLEVIWEQAGDGVLSLAFIPLYHACGEPMRVFGHPDGWWEELEILV